MQMKIIVKKLRLNLFEIFFEILIKIAYLGNSMETRTLMVQKTPIRFTVQEERLYEMLKFLG